MCCSKFLSVSINSSPSSERLANFLGGHEVARGLVVVSVVGGWSDILHGCIGSWGVLLTHLICLRALLRGSLEAISKILHVAKVHEHRDSSDATTSSCC